MSPKLFVLSGPSGVGKTTIVRALLQMMEGVKFSVSCTTRPPRRGEKEGVDYYFISRKQFEKLVKLGKFLEHASVYGHHYGTPRAEVEGRLSGGESVLLDIDTQGAAQVRRRGQKIGLPMRFIFILPPSKEELRRRITERRSEPASELERRFRAAWQEIDAGSWFDYLVVNRTLEEAISQVARLISMEGGWQVLE